MNHVAAIFILALCGAVQACVHDSYYLAEISWSAEEPFLIECLSSNLPEDSIRISVIQQEIKKKYKHVNLTCRTLPIRVDVEERKNAPNAPIIMVKTTGSGYSHSLARFENKMPSMEQLDRVFSSPVRSKIIASLKQKKIVLLAFQGKDRRVNKEFLACAAKGKKMVKDILDGECEVIEVSLAEAGEEVLIENVFARRVRPRPGIFIVFGKGKGIHFLQDPKSPQIILDVAQMLNHPTDADSHILEPRLLLDMAIPEFSPKPE